MKDGFKNGEKIVKRIKTSLPFRIRQALRHFPKETWKSRRETLDLLRKDPHLSLPVAGAESLQSDGKNAGPEGNRGFTQLEGKEKRALPSMCPNYGGKLSWVP